LTVLFFQDIPAQESYLIFISCSYIYLETVEKYRI